MKADRRKRIIRGTLQRAPWLMLGIGLGAVVIRLSLGMDAVYFAPIVGTAVLSGFLLGRSRGAKGLLVAYFVALGFFTQLRDAADETGIATASQYVVDWELWLFGGAAPSAWLQSRIGGLGAEPGGIAYLSAFVHWLWFVFPHATVVGLYLFARRMASRVIPIVAGTFYLGLVIYFLLPTAPPWMAAEQGLLGGVVRGMDVVGPAILGSGLYDGAFEALAEPNPSAAMPSLHFAASFVIVLVGLLIHSRFLTALALVYSAALAFALMYLGEHYFVDIAAGAGAALAAFLLAELTRAALLAVRRRQAEISAAARRWEERLREALRRPGRRLEAS